MTQREMELEPGSSASPFTQAQINAAPELVAECIRLHAEVERLRNEDERLRAALRVCRDTIANDIDHRESLAQARAALEKKP